MAARNGDSLREGLAWGSQSRALCPIQDRIGAQLRPWRNPPPEGLRNDEVLLLTSGNWIIQDQGHSSPALLLFQNKSCITNETLLGSNHLSPVSSSLISPFLFLSFFIFCGYAARLAESQFPFQGLNQGHGSESDKS